MLVKLVREVGKMNQLLAKLTSGRWIMTVSLTLTICTLGIMGRISPDDIMKIALMVVAFYFTKRDDNGKAD